MHKNCLDLGNKALLQQRHSSDSSFTARANSPSRRTSPFGIATVLHSKKMGNPNMAYSSSLPRHIYVTDLPLTPESSNSDSGLSLLEFGVTDARFMDSFCFSASQSGVASNMYNYNSYVQMQPPSSDGMPQPSIWPQASSPTTTQETSSQPFPGHREFPQLAPNLFTHPESSSSSVEKRPSIHSTVGGSSDGGSPEPTSPRNEAQERRREVRGFLRCISPS